MTDIIASPIPYISATRQNGPVFAGQPVQAAEIVVPAAGLWHIDVLLVGTKTPEPLPATGTLITFKYAGLTMLCSVFRDITFPGGGTRGFRLIAGTGGLRKPVPGQSYTLSNGVQASMVVADAARACGEQIVVAQDRSLGNHWVRATAPISTLMWNLFGSTGWFADYSGVMQTKARDTSPITSEFTVMGVDSAAGLYEIATEFPEDWTPGRSFSSPVINPATISRLSISVDKQRPRIRVLAA